MAFSVSVQGIKRRNVNRYDYVSVSHDSEIVVVAAREGGGHSGYADLKPDAVRKLIRALQDALFDMGEA